MLNLLLTNSWMVLIDVLPILYKINFLLTINKIKSFISFQLFIIKKIKKTINESTYCRSFRRIQSSRAEIKRHRGGI